MDRIVLEKAGIRRRVKGRILSLGLSKPDGGYRQAMLTDGTRRQMKRVHVAIAEAWHGPRPPGALACHWDGDRERNTPVNIYWGTHRTNALDRARHGNYASGWKEGRCRRGHDLTDPANVYLMKSGGRQCKPCRRIHDKRRYYKDKEGRS